MYENDFGWMWGNYIVEYFEGLESILYDFLENVKFLDLKVA